MPIFTFRCKRCGHMFDLLVGVNQEKCNYLCPQCQGQDLEKQPSVFGVSSARGAHSACSCSSCAGPTPACPQGGCPLTG